MLPEAVMAPLQEHLRHVKTVHDGDLVQAYGSVHLPYALERCASIPQRSGVDKYPNANREWIWQYVFPASKRSKDPRTGAVRRHHVHESGLQKAVRKAAQRAGINKRISCHTFRQCEASRGTVSLPTC
jgi:integrase